MKASRHVKIAMLLLIIFAGTALGLFLRQPDWLFHWRNFRTGNLIVSRVEAYRTDHKRLPEALNEVGEDDADLKVFYRRINGNDYCVWFGTTLGESEVYNSRSKKWEIDVGCD